MSTEEVYIRMIDGTCSLIPVSTTKVDKGYYKINADPSFNENNDPVCLFEFYPGDLVDAKNQEFQDGTLGLVGNTLINTGNWPDRKYLVFKFLATLNEIRVDKEVSIKYQDEIDRILTESKAGLYFYPALLEVVDRLKVL